MKVSLKAFTTIFLISVSAIVSGGELWGRAVDFFTANGRVVYVSKDGEDVTLDRPRVVSEFRFTDYFRAPPEAVQ